MAITQVGSTSWYYGRGYTVYDYTGLNLIAIARPSGVQVGDVLIMSFHANNGGGYGYTEENPYETLVCQDTPFTYITRRNITQGFVDVYYRVVGPFDPTTYYFRADTVYNYHNFYLSAFRGCDPDSPIGNTSASTSTSSTTAHTVPSLTVQTDGNALVYCGTEMARPLVITPPSGFVTLRDHDDNISWWLHTSWDSSVAAGATGDLTATIDTACYYAAVVVELRQRPANTQWGKLDAVLTGRLTKVGFSTLGDTGASTSYDLYRPSGVQDADILLVTFARNQNTAPSGHITLPSGWAWTGINSAHSKNVALGVAWKRAGPSEPSYYTFTCSSSLGWAYSLSAWRGVGAIGNASASTSTSSTTAMSAPSITVQAAGNAVLYIGANLTSAEHIAPSSLYVEVLEARSTDGAARLELSRRYSHPAGNAGSVTATAEAKSYYLAGLLELRASTPYTVTASLDAILATAGTTETEAASLDAYLQKAGFTATGGLDALLQKQAVAATASVDAGLAVAHTATAGLDAILLNDRYLIATGNSNSTSVWSATSGGAAGASVPTEYTRVYLNAASGAANLTLVGDLDSWTFDADGFTGTLTQPDATNLFVHGPLLRFSAGMTYALGASYGGGEHQPWVWLTHPGEVALYTNGQKLPGLGVFDGVDVHPQDANLLLGGLSAGADTFTWGTTTCTLYSQTPQVVGPAVGELTIYELRLVPDPASDTLVFTTWFNITVGTFYVEPGAGRQLLFDDGKFFTATTWDLNCLASSPTVISHNGTGSAFLAKAGGGIVYVDHAVISYTNASPASTFYAPAAANSGSNFGWTWLSAATVTGSLDAHLAAPVTATASVDAVLQAAVTTSASLDALLQQAEEGAGSLDALLRGTATASVGLDAALAAPTTRSAALDGYLAAAGTATGSLDASLQAVAARAAALDACLAVLASAATSVGALLQQSAAATAGLDALLQATQAAAASLDALLATARTAAGSLDALLQSGEAKTVGLDAVLAASVSASVALDAMLQGAGTAGASLDARLQAAQQTTSSLDAVLATRQAASAGLDAVVQAQRVAATATLDAQLAEACSASVGFDALLQKALTATASADALLQAAVTVTGSLDALLQETQHAEAAVDATLQQSFAATAGLDAVLIVSTQTVTATVGAYLAAAATTTTSVDATLAATATAAGALDALLRAEGLRATAGLDGALAATTITAVALDAALQAAASAAADLDAHLAAPQTATTSVDSHLAVAGAQTAGTDALLQAAGLTATAGLNAHLASAQVATASVDALLEAGLTRTASADALLQAQRTNTTSLDAALAAVQTSAASADALLEKSRSSGTGLDACLAAIATSAAAVDALLQAQVAAAASLDVLVKLEGVTSTTGLDARLVSATSALAGLDALLQATVAQTTAADACLANLAEASASLDAILSSQETVAAGLDALLRQTETAAAGLDALLRATATATANIDALLQAAATAATDLDALLQGAPQVTAGVDALLQTAVGVTVSADALLAAGHEVTADADALLAAQQTAVSQLDGLLKAQEVATAGLDALLQTAVALTAVLDAVLATKGEQTVAASLDAWLHGGWRDTWNIIEQHTIQALQADAKLGPGGVLEVLTWEQELPEDAGVYQANLLPAVAVEVQERLGDDEIGFAGNVEQVYRLVVVVVVSGGELSLVKKTVKRCAARIIRCLQQQHQPDKQLADLPAALLGPIAGGVRVRIDRAAAGGGRLESTGSLRGLAEIHADVGVGITVPTTPY